MKKLIAVLLAGLMTAAAAQYVQWRLIGVTYNGNGTVTCVYEGRTSDGQRVTTTIIAQGFCPAWPQ